VAEVSRRFGMSIGVPLPQLCWREAGELFALNSQASWEECLQRRGLVAQPGRLELCVHTDDPPPLPMHLRAPARRPTAGTYRPELFTWQAERAPGRRTFGRQTQSRAGLRSPVGAPPHDFFVAPAAARSPLGGCREPVAHRELISAHRELLARSPPIGRGPMTLEPSLAGADEERRRLHVAAVKLQNLFRDSRNRRQAQDGPTDAELEDLPHRLPTGLARPKAFISTHSRGFNSTERSRHTSDAPIHNLGQTNEILPIGRLQSRHARRSGSRSRGFLGRSISPKAAKSPPYQPYKTKQVLDLGTGSRLQVDGKCAPQARR